MKNAILLSCILLFTGVSFSQGVSVNENGNPADPTAMLDISSHTKGVLVTRLRTMERTAIQNPVEGLFTYDIDTHSFWVYTIGVWKELLKSGDPIMPGGPASGDLNGSYPSPTVSKIQNLDVDFGVPFDHQVLKWDALNNNWKGRNDSLFLPYKATYGDTGALFSIRNNNSTNGASAIRGRRGIGSGITPATTMGVWGDNVNGLGVVGTSNTGIGTYGLSFGNHGVYGYSTLAGFAGVKGSHANSGGIGVMGEVQTSGYGVLGLSSGDSGKAGSFQSSSPTNADTTLTVSTQGLGTLSQFNISNATNNKPVIDIVHNGSGSGLTVRLNKSNSSANGIDAVIQGNGVAVYGKSAIGTSGKFEINNASSNSPALVASTNGLGSALSVNSSNANLTANVADIVSQGTGTALNVNSVNGQGAGFQITGQNNQNPVMNLLNSGKGYDINIYNTNANNNSAVIKAKNSGSGNFLLFQDGNSSNKLTVDNAGSVVSAGTVTVHNNNGIIRNSGSAQLRIENILSPWIGGNIPNGATWTVYAPFNTPFSVHPSVFIGNATLPVSIEPGKLIVYVSEVTNDGCTISITNNTPFYIFFAAEWNLLVLGPE